MLVFFISNLLRNFAYGLTGGKFIFASAKNRRIRKYQRQLTRMSAALALLADTNLILLGGSLKRRERISARLGDLLSYLYLASTVLKYYYDNSKPIDDIDYVCWSLQYCLYKIQITCNELFNNFPKLWLGKLLNWIIFPFGQAYQQPKDNLHNSIVSSMLTVSELRDRITQHCYISKKEDNLSYRLDKALSYIKTTDPILKKLHKAVQSKRIPHEYSFTERMEAAYKEKILTKEEIDLLSEFELLRKEIIQVNEFSFDLDNVIA